MTLGRRGQEQFSGTRYYCTTAPTVIISDTFLSRQAGEVSTIIYDTVVDVAEMQHQVAPKTLRDKKNNRGLSMCHAATLHGPCD